jgi:DNA-binding NarL/FixJ family response regulator
VLVGGFDDIPEIGLRSLLDEVGYEVVAIPVDEILQEVGRLRPDAILVEHECDRDLSLARQIRTAHSQVTVIVCSGSQERMNVFPVDGIAYEADLDDVRLVQALGGRRERKGANHENGRT